MSNGVTNLVTILLARRTLSDRPCEIYSEGLKSSREPPQAAAKALYSAEQLAAQSVSYSSAGLLAQEITEFP